MGSRARWVRAIAVAAIGAVVLGLGSFTAVWRAEAAPSALAGASATGTLAADPYSVWLAQMNRDGICALITGCQSATGSGTDWVLSMLVDVPGLGLQTVPVPVQVSDVVPYRSMRLRMTAEGAIGAVNADVDVALVPRSGGTAVTLTIDKATTSGLAEAFVRQFITQFEPSVQDQIATMNGTRASADVRVALTIQRGRKATARVRVTAATMSATPPVASGTMRVLAGSRTLCVAQVRSSRGVCRFSPPSRSTVLRAVVIGEFDNGYPLWNSAVARYRP